MNHTAKTLLEMSSSQIPFEPNKAALVLIDFQREYTTGKLPLFNVQAAVKETERLVTWARQQQVPVVHVFHVGSAGGVFDPAAEGGRPIAELAPKAGESVVYKKLPNSFAGTDLQSILEKQGKSSLIVAGLMTHMCLEATTRAGFDLGFNSLVVADATTTRDLPFGENVVKAADLKAASLAALGDLVAAVVPGVSAVQARFDA